MRIDSHQHFWKYSEAEYPWMKAQWPIRRDYLPEDLAPELARAGLDGCVAVQARQSLEETRWLLELADGSPMIRGVVGWVDLRSEQVEAQLELFAANPKLVGVRHVVQDEPDERFMLGKAFQRGISKLKGFGLSYDLLVFPNQLSAAIELVGAFPDQSFVLDHLAKPAIRDGTLSPWDAHIRALALHPNVMCKVSGMVTEARWNGWQPADFPPYLDLVLEAFGPDRLMFGSDWPVALLAAQYEDVCSLVRGYFSQMGPEVEAKIFGLNAALFYKL